MDLFGFLLATLAVWRITYLLSEENGPWEILGRLRRFAAGSLAGVLDCFYCLSLWIALPIALGLGGSWKDRLLLWPSLSASAIFLQQLIRQWTAKEPLPVTYFEQPFAEPLAASQRQEIRDVMLRP